MSAYATVIQMKEVFALIRRGCDELHSIFIVLALVVRVTILLVYFCRDLWFAATDAVLVCSPEISKTLSTVNQVRSPPVIAGGFWYFLFFTAAYFSGFFLKAFGDTITMNIQCLVLSLSSVGRN